MIPCCVFCGEKDPHKLTMSTRIVNGKSVTIDACFNCYWREQFVAGGEDGMLSEGKTNRESVSKKREPSAAGIQERIKLKG
jgi:hypothetical protein